MKISEVTVRRYDAGVAVPDLSTGRETLIVEIRTDEGHSAAKLVKHGHRALQLRASFPATSLKDAVGRVRAVREAIGPDVKIMVDVNGTWTTDIAIQQLRAWEPYDVYWLEEPVPVDDY